MKAAVLHAQKDIRVEDIDKPIINENEVLIRVKASGVCGYRYSSVLGTASSFISNCID